MDMEILNLWGEHLVRLVFLEGSAFIDFHAKSKESLFSSEYVERFNQFAKRMRAPHVVLAYVECSLKCASLSHPSKIFRKVIMEGLALKHDSRTNLCLFQVQFLDSGRHSEQTSIIL